MPLYASPEQLMRERSELARKGIARGRSVVVLTYAGGVLFVAEIPPKSTLHKVSEIYDKIGFAAAGRYSEYESLRRGGIRHVELWGYAYDRRDVSARQLANVYAQTLSAIFTDQLKPYEVEICVAEVGAHTGEDQLFRLTYDGSINDEPQYVVLGGQAETISNALKATYTEGLELAPALELAVRALSTPPTGPAGQAGKSVNAASQANQAANTPERPALDTTRLEVAVLERSRPNRAFRRISGAALTDRLNATVGMADDPAVTDVRLDPLILAFYQDRYREDERLTRSAHGRLEFARTQELLRRFLPPAPARVLDVGGGTGVHARWLAADGYTVHLVDPVPDHVADARRIAGVSAADGDARALRAAGDSADATLLLGPLYHLVDVEDRLRALREATRVTRPGGLVVAAAISRYAALLELGGSGRLDDEAVRECQRLLATGRHHDDPRGFTDAHFHLPDELAWELRAVGLRDVRVLGVEGPSAPVLDNAPPERVDALLPSAIRCARLVEADPALIAACPHLLAFGRVTEQSDAVGG
jgi:proteasome alpha subunit